MTNLSFKKFYDISKTFETYNIEKDAHMMKNSEWGAVAYLAHSKYGINDKISANIFRFRSGCAAPDGSDCYGEIKNYKQSTTGNITGIFDMVGGNFEAVMGNYRSTLSESGFTILPEKKYYDEYLYMPFNNENSKGHAVSETKGWYSTSIDTIINYPWIFRGGDYTTQDSDLYSLNYSSGIEYYNSAFRVVIG